MTEKANRDDRIAELSTLLAGMTGPSRISRLLELVRLLVHRHQEGGPSAAADLDAAIHHLTEAHRMLEPTDPLRMGTAQGLGDLLYRRRGAAADMNAAVNYLEEALVHPALRAANREVTHIKVAAILLARVMEGLPDAPDSAGGDSFPNFAARLRGEAGRAAIADVDTALRHLHAVTAAEPVNRQFHTVASMLSVQVQMLRNFLEVVGSTGDFDLTKMASLWSPAMQSLLDNAPGRVDVLGVPHRPPATAQGSPVVSPRSPVDSDAAALGVHPGVATPRTVTAEVAALRRYADMVRTADSGKVLDIAWEAVTEAMWAVEHCLADGRPADAVELLELGRGLLLHAATGAGIPAAAPDAVEIAAALRAAGREALVYLLAEHLLLVTVAGDTIDLAAPELTAVPPAPSRWHDWAWPAVIQPLLGHLGPRPEPPRVVLAPTAALGQVPWHAARTREPDGRYRYACHDLVISYAASARQWLEAAHRPPTPVDDVVVFVANPAGDRDRDTFETMALRRYVYPRSIGLGHTGEHAAGAGTPDEVAAHLPSRDGAGASLLHLGCRGRVDADPSQSHLELAGGATLRMDRIRQQSRGRNPDAPGGLVVLTDCIGDLPADRVDSAFALSSALLATGAASVIEAGWPAPVPTPSPLLTLFHHLLTGERLPPADALRRAQLWLLDPDRRPPEGMVGSADPDLADPSRWAGVRHHGR